MNKFKSYKKWVNEKFMEDTDPIEDLNIGLRVKIEKWLKDMGITVYRLTPEMEINVYDDTYLTRKVKGALPDYIQFNVAVGDFSICFCELTTLRGCPREIWGYFNCSYNNLESLEYAPKEVHMTKRKSGGFYCGRNAKQFTKEDVELVCDVEGTIRI